MTYQTKFSYFGIFKSFAIAGIIFLNPFCGDYTYAECQDCFVLSSSGKSAPLYISSQDWPGVIRAFRDLQTDIGRVTGSAPNLYIYTLPVTDRLPVIETLPVIDTLPVTRTLHVTETLPVVNILPVIDTLPVTETSHVTETLPIIDAPTGLDAVPYSDKPPGYDAQPGLDEHPGFDTLPGKKQIVIAGTIGKSPLIDKLIRDNKIDVRDIAGKWECFLIQVIQDPAPGIEKALVIAGSDKRGTIYGIYEISEQIGVSPWYWWGDVPPVHQPELYILPCRYTRGEPSVKYRGLFLNDEAPALTNWVAAKFGMVTPSEDPPIPEGVANYGHEFYEKLFELILRIRGNYLWPAMWNNAFNEDDPANARLADEYGIVMGTSHQEPMLRAQKEWDRRYLRTLGRWNYVTYKDTLEEFWREGIRRNRDYESIITIGLRGANDTEMMPGGPEANIPFLEKIVNVQRKMITKEINPDITKVPQLWCLYKEVQDYYNTGMRVPGDVTLLWAEDNWGNIRRLPTREERDRPGGAGIYYHFDYHGGPRSYQWINTNPIPKIWDQMSLAKQYGADRIWIVNAGHFKGYEFPIEYFMRLGWNTDMYSNENIIEYTRLWAQRQFGPGYTGDIAEIISKYTKYNGRRKPELLHPETYSLINYNEAENILKDYNAIVARAEEIYVRLEPEKRDAFYQLVLFPAKASALVNELYITAGKNYLYARQGRASTNDMAMKTELLFQVDTALMGYYNRSFAGGKWNHFMDQSHLGYTGWADPPFNSLRAINLKKLEIPRSAIMGIAVEGSGNVWPQSRKDRDRDRDRTRDINRDRDRDIDRDIDRDTDTGTDAVLPGFDVFNRQEHWIDVFNKGKKPFRFTAEADNSWIHLSEPEGIVEKDVRLWIGVDWEKVPYGRSTGKLKIKSAGKNAIITVNALKPDGISPETLHGFIEGEGYVSIEAEHYTKNSEEGASRWIKIEDYGHTLSAMRATAPVDAPPAIPAKNSPCLEYRMYLFTAGDIEVETIFSPTLNFLPGRGLKYAISFDDDDPQIVILVPENFNAQNGNRDWEKTVMDNARFSKTKHSVKEPGYHTLKIWMIDPGPVLQKIVVNTGGVRPSYLRPPESFFRYH